LFGFSDTGFSVFLGLDKIDKYQSTSGTKVCRRSDPGNGDFTLF